MSAGSESSERVREVLERLHATYGDFPVRERRVENDPERFEAGREMVAEGWIGDAGAWISDDRDRVLLIRHAGAPDRWGTPGGGHEPPEDIAETARREVREEVGVECTLTGAHAVRRKTVVHTGEPRRRWEMLTVGFEADYESGEIDVGDEEVLEARWFEDPPDRVDPFLEAKVDEWTGDGG